MNEYKFITNELLIKNNKGLKSRGQFGVDMEVERRQFGLIIPLEEYPEGTHFEVTIRPISSEPPSDPKNQSDLFVIKNAENQDPTGY